VLWLACVPAGGNPQGKVGDSAGQESGEAAPDTAAPGESAETGDPDEPAVAVAPATSGALELSFSLDVSAEGRDRLSEVALATDVGGLALDGAAHAAVAYQDHDWESAGYHLYDLLSVAEDGTDLGVTYLYCDGEDVPYAYTESFDLPMDWESASGSCVGEQVETDASVELPALRVTPEAVPTGVTFEDGEMAGGDVTLDGTTRTWIPFNTVDCTDCPGGPWYELHSLLVGDSEACFAIAYLFPDDPTFAQWEYGLCLPSLSRPAGVVEGSWSGALSGPPRPAGLARPRPSFRR
jgi:hypothetical protein